MNKKGFTVVELLASFTLTMIIVVFLFEIVLELKDVYVNNALKTKVLNQNALIATKLDKTLDNLIVSSANCSGNSCTINGYSSNLVISIGSDKVSFGSEQIKMPSDAAITLTNFSANLNNAVTDSAKDNAYIRISYDVTSPNLNKPVHFNYIYSYHQN